MSDNQKPKYAEPSDEFLYAFGYGGTSHSTCDFCGVTYFSELGDYDEGEIEVFRERAKADAAKWVEEKGCHGVSISIIGGRRYVHGCPCHGARPYEDFVWSHRFSIIEYITERNKQELEASQTMADALAEVAAKE